MFYILILVVFMHAVSCTFPSRAIKVNFTLDCNKSKKFKSIDNEKLIQICSPESTCSAPQKQKVESHIKDTIEDDYLKPIDVCEKANETKKNNKKYYTVEIRMDIITDDKVSTTTKLPDENSVTVTEIIPPCSTPTKDQEDSKCSCSTTVSPSTGDGSKTSTIDESSSLSTFEITKSAKPLQDKEAGTEKPSNTLAVCPESSTTALSSFGFGLGGFLLGCIVCVFLYFVLGKYIFKKPTRLHKSFTNTLYTHGDGVTISNSPQTEQPNTNYCEVNEDLIKGSCTAADREVDDAFKNDKEEGVYNTLNESSAHDLAENYDHAHHHITQARNHSDRCDIADTSTAYEDIKGNSDDYFMLEKQFA